MGVGRPVEILSRAGRDGGEVRRTGIVVASATQMNKAPFRSDIIGNAEGRCRPDGAENYFSFDSTNMPRLTAL